MIWIVDRWFPTVIHPVLHVRYGSKADVSLYIMECPLYPPKADILSVEINVR
jgi:hypothetical protein